MGVRDPLNPKASPEAIANVPHRTLLQEAAAGRSDPAPMAVEQGTQGGEMAAGSSVPGDGVRTRED
eukprot:1178820-Rhodomonas_salina.1